MKNQLKNFIGVFLGALCILGVGCSSLFNTDNLLSNYNKEDYRTTFVSVFSNNFDSKYYTYNLIDDTSEERFKLSSPDDDYNNWLKEAESDNLNSVNAINFLKTLDNLEEVKDIEVTESYAMSFLVILQKDEKGTLDKYTEDEFQISYYESSNLISIAPKNHDNDEEITKYYIVTDELKTIINSL